jgi:hypothetical protein
MYHVYDARQALSQAIGHGASAIGRVVIHDEHRQAGHGESMELCNKARQVIGFVIGGNDDDGFSVLRHD